MYKKYLKKISKNILITIIRKKNVPIKIVNYKLKPVFNVLGQKYGSKVNEIITLLKNIDVEDFIKIISTENEFQLPGSQYLIKNEDVLKFQLLINGIHVNPEKWLIKK